MRKLIHTRRCLVVSAVTAALLLAGLAIPSWSAAGPAAAHAASDPDTNGGPIVTSVGDGGLGQATDSPGTGATDTSLTDTTEAASGTSRYADFLDTPTLVTGSEQDDTTATTAATADPQCAVPPASRTGSWSCQISGGSPLGDVSGTPVMSDPVQNPVQQQAVTIQPDTSSTGTDTVTPDSQTGYCRIQGCWIRYNDFHADWQSNEFVYGYGETTLGYGNMYVNWQLTGPKTTVGPVYLILSGPTTSVTASCALLNGANGTTGGRLIAGPHYYDWTTAHSAHTRYSWPSSKYCWLREYASWDHNTDVQFSWHVPGWYGMYWYSYVRSIVSHTTSRNSASAIYRFDAANMETQDPAKGGWRPQ